MTKIFLVDASSNDGTIAAVRASFPEASIISCHPNVFWAEGMSIAWAASKELEYGFALLLNDDVELFEDSLARLYRASANENHASVIVGSTCDPVSGELTYGGLRKGPPWKRLSLDLVPPGREAKPVDFANGNLVWLPRDVLDNIGGFPSGFRHGIADLYLTGSASSSGVTVLVSPGYFGTCRKNSPKDTWVDPSASFRRRVQLLHSPKGLPALDWIRFCFRFGGLSGPLYMIWPYFTLAISHFEYRYGRWKQKTKQRY